MFSFLAKKKKKKAANPVEVTERFSSPYWAVKAWHLGTVALESVSSEQDREVAGPSVGSGFPLGSRRSPQLCSLPPWQVVAQILPFRDQNRAALDGLWNRHHVERVEIVMKETLDAEGA